MGQVDAILDSSQGSSSQGSSFWEGDVWAQTWIKWGLGGSCVLLTGKEASVAAAWCARQWVSEWVERWPDRQAGRGQTTSPAWIHQEPILKYYPQRGGFSSSF